MRSLLCHVDILRLEFGVDELFVSCIYHIYEELENGKVGIKLTDVCLRLRSRDFPLRELFWVEILQLLIKLVLEDLSENWLIQFEGNDFVNKSSSPGVEIISGLCGTLHDLTGIIIELLSISDVSILPILSHDLNVGCLFLEDICPLLIKES